MSIALTDISVRKGVEARLNEAMAAAEKANRAKTDFLSSMSHELRTPLNAILGFAQIMESSTPPPTATQQRDLERILKAGWYLLELINEVLDLTLIESGKAMLSYEAVALNDVMLECQALIEPQAQQRGIELRLPLGGVFRYVTADRTRLKQVLINLLFNAVKYNKPGGEVSIECIPRPSNSIRISVRDTGAGLTQEQVEQLFQPFNRLGKEAGGEEGTGIGLVVTKRLVELMGGAAFTAGLFSLGKALIGLYLGNSGIASSFGAAGSLIALLLWVYYSAQIFFLGAEFTRHYALWFGSLQQERLREEEGMNGLA